MTEATMRVTTIMLLPMAVAAVAACDSPNDSWSFAESLCSSDSFK